MKKKFEKYLMKVIKKYTPLLLLQRHVIEVKQDDQGRVEFFECSCSYPYLNVVMWYSKSAFKGWKKGRNLTSYIVHELCHPITDPLYTKAIARHVSKNEILDERENLTEHICNIVLKLSK